MRRPRYAQCILQQARTNTYRTSNTAARNRPRAAGSTEQRRTTCPVQQETGDMKNATTTTCSMQRQHAACIQQATGNMDRATRSRERRAAGCVDNETCSMHTLRERCNLQQQDPYRMQYAGMRACGSMLLLHAASCPLRARHTQHATCTVSMQHAPCSMQHQASQSTDNKHAALKK